jgi:hypothetical protein
MHIAIRAGAYAARVRRIRFAVFVVAIVVFAACGGDDDDSSSSTTAATTTPTTADLSSTGVTTPLTDVPATAGGQGTRVAALITSVDLAAKSVTYDEIDFLTGDDAVTAYRADHPEDPEGFPENDYYSTTDDTTVATQPFASDVTVKLVEMSKDSDADLDAATINELATYDVLQNVPFWLTLDKSGTITSIEEQYLP